MSKLAFSANFPASRALPKIAWIARPAVAVLFAFLRLCWDSPVRSTLFAN